MIECLPHHPKIQGSSLAAADDTSDLYYKHVTIVNYATIVVNYAAGGIIYNRNMQIVQALGVISSSWT